MTATPTTGTPRSVLVVDDVMVNRRLAVAIFHKLGWQCSEVDGGNAALNWLRSNPAVDLVLLDIRMPDLNGEEVCRELRSDPAFATLPIVAYTAHAMQMDIDRFLANGFNEVLIKPISVQGLRDLVTELFPD
ncbi:response regulator [Propionivibrio sp.]|uniref:response regulator n=1 Tax=Propionivibrio sp. TaxID=2212460 RepID=UPI003BF4195B